MSKDDLLKKSTFFRTGNFLKRAEFFKKEGILGEKRRDFSKLRIFRTGNFSNGEFFKKEGILCEKM